MDDKLLNEQNYNDMYYYPGATDPNKKDPQQRFTCSLCGREYSWMYSLRRHQLQCGNQEARNKCQFCSRKFYRRDRLKEHMLAHHPELI
ncbi:zinc finger protein ehn-3-like [Hylaeus anthracinus]|uniref:zinc finger protein ehn-3-like n=1 Tax=Hylaeus anthracinus TaxID=313031 RepID=UPI0023BA0FAB|nr:zinc finger protein ehn-3-like [Hylaeus anthracinus]